MAPSNVDKSNKSTLFDSFLKIVNSFGERGMLVKEQDFTSKKESEHKEDKSWDIATKETLSTFP